MNTVSKRNTQPPIPSIERTQSSSFRIILDKLKLSLIIFILYLILSLFHIGCPIKALSGISCPGCGMTRAVESVFALNFKDAFYYHPLFMLTPIMFLLFLLDHLLPTKLRKIAWSIIIVFFITIYLYRLLLTKNDVVEIDIWSGVVLKLLHYIVM